MAGLAPLLVALANPRPAALAVAALWLLPDWVDRWLDVRDRWQGPGP